MTMSVAQDMATKIILSVLIVLNLVTFTFSHGRMIEPAARNAAWRYGFKVPVNFDENQQNCGGFATQWKTNNGKCGVCGDKYNADNASHVFPGKYAKGVITKNYTAGEVIRVKIEITANHKGWFEFRLGKISKGQEPVTQDKLTHLLRLVEGGTRWHLNSEEMKVYSIDLKLPDNLTCEHCVLQWWWKCGNNWGCDESNKCGTGHGAQETFVNCADICIFPNDDSSDGNNNETTIQPPVGPTATSKSGSEATFLPTTANENAVTSKAPPTTVSIAVASTTPAQSTAIPRPADQCRATGLRTGQAAMDIWCRVNCGVGNCPASHCICGSRPTDKSVCKATGPWKGQVAMDTWCVLNCARGYCPAKHCVCVSDLKPTEKPVLQ